MPRLLPSSLLPSSPLYLQLGMTNRGAKRDHGSCEICSLQITKYFEQKLENVITTYNCFSLLEGDFCRYSMALGRALWITEQKSFAGSFHQG